MQAYCGMGRGGGGGSSRYHGRHVSVRPRYGFDIDTVELEQLGHELGIRHTSEVSFAA